jgi:hypothetical protein
VALSADGNTAIVGGFNDNGGVGAAWIYTRSGGAGSQQGSKLVGVGGVGGSAFQGNSVAISADGNTAILGAPHDNGSIGTAWVFVNPAIPTGPTISSGGVVNGANFLPGIAPGTWITIRGSNLSAATRIWTDSDFSGNNGDDPPQSPVSIGPEIRMQRRAIDIIGDSSAGPPVVFKQKETRA